MEYPKKLSFFLNFSWNFIGSIVYAFSQWLALIIIAQFGSVEEVGIYSIGMALTAPIIMFTNLQLRSIQATDTSNEYSFGNYFALRIVGNSVAIIITLLIFAIGIYDINKAFIIFLILISKIIDSFSNVIYGQFQKNERMDYIGLSRVLKGLGTLSVMFVAYILSRDLIITLICMNVCWLFIFWIYDLKHLKKFRINIYPKFEWDKIKTLTKLALPLGFAIMIISLNINIPRIAVERILGDAAIGYFAALLYFMVAGETLINAVGQSIAPRLARSFKDKKYNQFKKIILRSLFGALLIGVIGIIISFYFGKIILGFVYGLEYSQFDFVLVLIMLGASFNYGSAILGYAITAMRMFRIQPYLGMVWLIVSILLSILLIPMFGLVGAASTLIGSYFIQFVVQLFLVYYKLVRSNRNLAH